MSADAAGEAGAFALPPGSQHIHTQGGRLKILVTGGAGYIGSHTCVALAHTQYVPVIVDNYCNSSPAVLQRLALLTGGPVLHEKGDVCDCDFLKNVIQKHEISAVVHFAAHKSAPESLSCPLKYHHNNLTGLLSLLQAMDATGCRTLVYSSSATVYGSPAALPIREDFPRSCATPYGLTKLVGEDILSSLCHSNSEWAIGTLRYFNPVGAHPSGLIGESPAGTPENLMPCITQVAVGKLPHLNIFGSDYPTPDGTAIRDFLHVMDLAEGHIAALHALLEKRRPFTVNLGTGKGQSVLDVVRAFEQATGKQIPINFAPRRPGDTAECWADPSEAHRILGWRATRSLRDMCADAWRWQQQNPGGY